MLSFHISLLRCLVLYTGSQNVLKTYCESVHLLALRPKDQQVFSETLRVDMWLEEQALNKQRNYNYDEQGKEGR